MGSKSLWLTAAVVACALVLGAWLFLSAAPFQLVVLFERVGDLKEGDPVTWRGFTIGKVEKVEPLVENRIGVTIRINEDYASRLTEASVFTLTEASFMGFVGQNGIDVSTSDSPGRAYTSGEKVPGTVTPRASLIQAGRQWTVEQWRQIRDNATQLARELRDSPLKAEAEEALNDLGRIAGDAGRQSKSGLEEFRRTHQDELDGVLRKLEKLREELKKKDIKPEMEANPPAKR